MVTARISLRFATSDYDEIRGLHLSGNIYHSLMARSAESLEGRSSGEDPSRLTVLIGLRGSNRMNGAMLIERYD